MERPARSGKQVRRIPGEPTPCSTCPKIPAGVAPVRENAREFDERLWKVWRHYLGCKALGRFPVQTWGEDPLLFQHARMLAEVERMYQESLARRLEMTLLQATFMTAARK